MKVTVCQLPDATEEFEEAWARLCEHVASARSDLALLPEMPFARWFATAPAFDPEIWSNAVDAHRSWENRLAELSSAACIATRPANRGARRLNEAFLAAAGRSRPIHEKVYLPNEEGFWEASWYERGDGRFEPATHSGASIGVQICTELWFMDAARAYGLAGIDVLAAPRSTPLASVERWVLAGRVAAIIAGAYCISSNRCGADMDGRTFGGAGWIIDPDGEILARTTDEAPFATLELDLSKAAAAKATYPRYVR